MQNTQVNKENRRFIVTGIDKKRRFENIQSDFDWLTNAGVALPVKRVSEAIFPLGLSRDEKARTPEVLPIEVKSGKNSKKHAALDHLLEVKNFHLKQAVVLHTKNVEVEESITYLPIYMTSFLCE